jgi:glycine/D-amino acid oxidase-like deaminating enzyme
VETDLVEPDELGEIDSALHPGGVVLAAYEPRGGYADPAATAVGFLRAAQQLGARFERRRVTALLEHRDRIQGVQTDGDPLEAEAVVVAAGAWSVPLTESLGLGLPIWPARVQVALFERPSELPTHLTLIDTTEGFYARPAAERATLVGSRDSFEGYRAPTHRRRSPTAPLSRKPRGGSAGAYRCWPPLPTVRAAPEPWT